MLKDMMREREGRIEGRKVERGKREAEGEGERRGDGGMEVVWVESLMINIIG